MGNEHGPALGGAMLETSDGEPGDLRRGREVVREAGIVGVVAVQGEPTKPRRAETRDERQGAGCLAASAGQARQGQEAEEPVGPDPARNASMGEGIIHAGPRRQTPGTPDRQDW